MKAMRNKLIIIPVSIGIILSMTLAACAPAAATPKAEIVTTPSTAAVKAPAVTPGGAPVVTPSNAAVAAPVITPSTAPVAVPVITPAPTTPTTPVTPTTPATPTPTPTATPAPLLVDAKWLNEHLNDATLIIIDGRPSTAYDAGHIKGAINLPVTMFNEATPAVTPADITLLMPAANLTNMFGQAGVSDKAQIVVYGDSIDYLGCRLFWMLESLGHSDVHVLDGGLNKWKSLGNPVHGEKSVKTATTFTAKPNSAVIATKAFVLSNYKATNFVLVDSRNAVDYVVKRIPGAVNLLMGDYLNTDSTLKSTSDLTALLSAKGITPGKTIITYCYVGYRSSQAYFIYRLLGYNVSNYDGSTTEWFFDTTLPTQP